MASQLTSDEAAMMIEKVREDTSLRPAIRNQATRISNLASQPARALRRLQVMALGELPDLPRVPPERALSRVVTAATFWEYMMRPEAQAQFTTADDFVRYVRTSTDSASMLREALMDGPVLFEWTRSWLAETEEIRRLSGTELNAALELGKRPPFVVFNLGLGALLDLGVTVRRPNALDSVLGPNPQWRPSGLASGLREFVDWDIPAAAVSSIDWRDA